MFVLAAILLTSVVLVALLGLSLTTQRVAANRARMAAEQRAADGAIQSTLGQIARSTASNPCAAVPADTASSTIRFEGNVDADVECVPIGQGDPADPTSPLGGAPVEIVGSRYDGGIAAPATGAVSPSLVFSGASALAFDADVSVRSGAAVSRNPAVGAAAVATDTAQGSAVTVTGQYQQGAAGPGATAGSSCGTLSPTGAQVASSLRDRDVQPVCSSSSASSLQPRTGSLFSPGDVLSDRDVPLCGATGSVVTFQEGRYDAVDTARLNLLFNGSCPDRTFWFQPGRYLFDVNDPAAVASDRNALVINDPTAKIIFGARTNTGPATAAEFPEACTDGVAGASIELSGRSALRHRQGMVVVCPAFTDAGTTLPAIVQAATAPSQATVSAPTLTGFDVNTFECDQLFVWQCPVRTFNVTASNLGTAPTQLTSAFLDVTSNESPPTHNALRSVTVTITPRPAARLNSCTTAATDGGRTGSLPTAFDLFTGSCATVLGGRTLDNADVTPSSLEGAKFTVVYTYKAGSDCPFGCVVHTNVVSVGLRTNVTLAEAVEVQDFSSWTNLDKVRTVGVPNAEVVQPACFIADLRCRHDKPQTLGFAVKGFTAASFGALRPTDHVQGLTAVVTSEAPNPTVFNETWRNRVSDPVDQTATVWELTLKGGQTCTVRNEGYSRSAQSIAVDLLDPHGTCRAAVERVDQLVGASLRMNLVTDCLWYGASRAPKDAQGRCDMVRPPDLDRVALQVTSDTTTRAPMSEVSVDVAHGTSFNVYGDTQLSATDLNVHWKGTVNERPVFGGLLSVNGLGSDQAAGATMGVVCCTPRTIRLVRVTAEVAGVERAGTDLDVDPPVMASPAGIRAISVLDWKYCGGAGCASVLGTQVTAHGP